MTELPGGWAEGALRQLGIWCGGGTPSKRVASYWVGDIPWVSPKDMKVERIKDTVDHISAEAVEESSTNLVSAGSILVVTRSGILSHSLPVAVTDREVALNQDLKALFPDDGIVAEYVAWALRSASRAILRDCSKAGTTVANIDTARLLDFRIPLAPLNEQRRIVAAIEEQLSRLDAADASLVAARRRLRAILRPVRERAIESGPERTLGDLLNGIEAGKSFKCHSRAADPDEWGVVKVSAMTWGAFNERENKAVISEERVDARWEINPGDLLLSRANTTDYVGATVLVGECRRRLLLSDKSMRLLVADGVYRPWLLHALSAPGSARSNVSGCDGYE